MGDESLSKRPMKRVIDPLQKMGAKFETSGKMTLPLTIKPSKALQNISYQMPVSSAQVKSAILIAGLHLEDETIVIENHTNKKSY